MVRRGCGQSLRAVNPRLFRANGYFLRVYPARGYLVKDYLGSQAIHCQVKGQGSGFGGIHSYHFLYLSSHLYLVVVQRAYYSVDGGYLFFLFLWHLGHYLGSVRPYCTLLGSSVLFHRSGPR